MPCTSPLAYLPPVHAALYANVFRSPHPSATRPSASEQRQTVSSSQPLVSLFQNDPNSTFMKPTMETLRSLALRRFAVHVLLLFLFTFGRAQSSPVVEVDTSPVIEIDTSPKSQITEAPSPELVRKNLEERAVFAPCTQWSLLNGGNNVGCYGTNTCLFTSAGGLWQFCGDINTGGSYATYCYNYPTIWIGASPAHIIYCPATAPYCGEYNFLIKGNSFWNLGCSTIPYDLTAVTKPGATFPGQTVALTASSVPPVTVTTTISTPIASVANPASSAIATATAVPCSDPLWAPSPDNWYGANVDQELAAWWADTTNDRNMISFVDWIAQNFGDLSHSQQCGIGQTCAPPDCQSFQSSGAPRWVYFVRTSLFEMNTLFNNMKTGMTDAESDLSLIIADMATNFFQWKDPTTNLQKALPWIEAVVTSILSFVPVIGPLIQPVVKAPWLKAFTTSAEAFVSAGFQELTTGGSNPVTHQLGTIEDLGVLIKNSVEIMRKGLETWTNLLYSGEKDSLGKTIIDYMAGGRFTLEYKIAQSFMDDFFLQVWVSKLVNEQWQDKANAPSQTFVMCTNATSPSSDLSIYKEAPRTCALYSINSDGNYVSPVGLDTLRNVTYNISPSDITASSLHSYMAQGLVYNDNDIESVIQQSISLTDNNTFLTQGIRFQGIWTLPVCDVGSYGSWVADPSAGMMPCCCGIGCSETLKFWSAAGILNLKALHSKCSTQCSTCPTSGTSEAFQIMGMDVMTGTWVLVAANLVAFLGGIW